jgi:hypothetical protein
MGTGQVAWLPEKLSGCEAEEAATSAYAADELEQPVGPGQHPAPSTNSHHREERRLIGKSTENKIRH